ncbi:hypothetical protein HUT16_17945 [Kitasatospora sp. NA04385]|uniref:hypothetical protein n=1 Tax=Kitasatospora sp. NA04385 TaxID=2742135 RepID=UPI001591A292|nr:hypothetical protein [Kitasatospora sp. NA04385]QKW20702.1 hypothetical protein HUT16_17945 [Kitasatospora sp. NA04385]
MIAHRTRRTTGPTVRRLLALPAALAVVLGAGACSGGSDRSDDGKDATALSYPKVRSTAQELGAAGSGTCPFGLDLAAALKATGVGLTANAGTEEDKPATGETTEATDPEPWPSGVKPPPSMASVPGRPPTGWITCVWMIDGGPITLDLLAVPVNDVGVSMMLPKIQAAGKLSAARLETVYAQRPAPGAAPLVTPDGGLAAIARVPAKGDGDLVLLLSQNPPNDGERALSGEPLGRVLARLAAGIHA